MANMLIALVVAWAGWWLWRGPGRRKPAVAPPKNQDDIHLAREILGVTPGAAPAEIRAAHRRLVALSHPDRGGSEEETRRLNIARDVLLGP